MGDGGGGGGDAPPLASKNLSPPLEPKIRDLKKSGQERGKNDFYKLFNFGFLSVQMAVKMQKNLAFLSYIFTKFPFFSAKNWFVPLPSPPLPLP